MLFPNKKEGARNIQEVIWFDRYLVLSELGKGSGSNVYLVRHQKIGEYRAVKRISKEPDFAWKIREADILNRLKHPQIPAIYDIEEDESYYYIVEEYFEGESLEALMLQSTFITLDFICYVIEETAGILNFMHQLSPSAVIYQDLKPEHVIVGKESIKLVDFGISCFLNDSGNKFQNYGTPDFCAPEKTNGTKVGIQTDIYSIGKLLEDMIDAECSKESHNLMHIAKKAMNPDLTERYKTIADFMADFREHMQSNQTSVKQKHLLKKIVAAGSQPRIGTTHLSISLTEYLNQKNIPAVYQEKNPGNHMRKIICSDGFTKDGGLYRRGDFVGIPAYGKGVSVNTERSVVQICDYGTDLEGAMSERADLFLLMIGSREWEMEYSDLAYEITKKRKYLAIISNYGNIRQAKTYAKKYACKVYCFPLDKNPFFMTKEKEELFDGLLEKEGFCNKEYWHCRKYPRKWGNSFIRGIGKLRSKRTGSGNSLFGVGRTWRNRALERLK